MDRDILFVWRVAPGDGNEPQEKGALAMKTLRSVLLAALAAAWPSHASAEITKLVISRTESPTFQGTSFGNAGPYEKLVGRASGEIDPRDPRHAVIADIALAPRNARGMVEYETDVFILRPVDPAKGNRRLFFDVNNRGNMRALASFNDARGGGNDPTSAADAGNGFLMRQGYTIVSSGWDVNVASGGNRLTIAVPIVTHPDGTPIVGPALEEVVVDNDTTLTGRLTYPAATRDKSRAQLTVRTRVADEPEPVPADRWELVDDSTFRLMPAGTAFQSGRLYELIYQARDPILAGLAFAALRDVAGFLKDASADREGRANPLAQRVERVYAFSVSQPSRFMHDFVALGFNDAGRGRLAFDGVFNWIGGASGGFFNYRFAQPGRTHRQHIGRWYPERHFPFANNVIKDDVSGKTDGWLRRCLMTKTCPAIFEVNSENEYWAKASSLLHTDTKGRDLPDPPNVRHYLLSSLPHAAASGPGMCQQPRNPIDGNPSFRALLVALDAWVAGGTPPPASRIPRRSDKTMVAAWPQEGVGFPTIPGVTYNGRPHDGMALSFGPTFGEGILTLLPPSRSPSPYPVLVPTTDADGNTVAGLRMVEVAVPTATYTGWALRAGPAAGEGCDAFGQMIPLASTKAERLARGDARLSIEERYPTHDDYVRRIGDAATSLVKARFLLDEDLQRYVSAAKASPIGRDGRR